MITRRKFLASAALALVLPAPTFARPGTDSSYNVSIGNVVTPVITRVGASTSQANTINLPSGYQPGDWSIICAGRGGSTTPPALPKGYLPILTKASSASSATSFRIGYKVLAASSGETSGIWTNANIMSCVVYRPPDGCTLGVGAPASSTSTNNTVTYPGLTLADAVGGNSWVVGFGCVANKTETIETAPSTMTNIAAGTIAAGAGTTYAIAAFDTNAAVSSFASANATTTGTAGKSVSATIEILMMAKGSAFPQVVQRVGGNGLSASNGSEIGNAFAQVIPNPVGAGNCLICSMTYPNGATVAITDNRNTWGAAYSHATASGALDSAVFVLGNAAAGATTITMTFNGGTGTINGFSFCILELTGIDTSSPTAGQHATSSPVTGPTITPGSYTPTNNDATGGNVIYTYYASSATGPSVAPVKVFTPSTYTLLSTGIFDDAGGNTGGTAATYTTPYAESLYLQATAAAINPPLSFCGDSSDAYNACSVALKVNSGAGTARPSGIKIAGTHVYGSSGGSTAANTTWSIPAPMVGNCRVLSMNTANNTTMVVRDSEGNVWTPDGNSAEFWYLANAVPNQNLTIYLDLPTGADSVSSGVIWDIVGAAASPFDISLAANQSDSWTSSPFTLTGNPAPTTTNGLVLCSIATGTGPCYSVTAPSGAVWDFVNYTGNADTGTLEFGNIAAHYYNASSGATGQWSFTGRATGGSPNGVTGGGWMALKHG